MESNVIEFENAFFRLDMNMKESRENRESKESTESKKKVLDVVGGQGVGMVDTSGKGKEVIEDVR